MTLLRNALFAAALALPATSAMAEIDILSVTFTCENGIPLPVTYFNAPDGSGAAATMVDNTLVAMRQVESGSGIRYESTGDRGNLYPALKRLERVDQLFGGRRRQ